MSSAWPPPLQPTGLGEEGHALVQNALHCPARLILSQLVRLHNAIEKADARSSGHGRKLFSLGGNARPWLRAPGPADKHQVRRPRACKDTRLEEGAGRAEQQPRGNAYGDCLVEVSACEDRRNSGRSLLSPLDLRLAHRSLAGISLARGAFYVAHLARMGRRPQLGLMC